MDNPIPSIRRLARQLLAASRDAGATTTEPDVDEVMLVIEKLRISLTRFAGTDGFASLLRRALVMATAEVPALKSITVGADGRLKGMDNLAGKAGAEAAEAITAHLLTLLITFIGESITLKLVRAAWPQTALGPVDQESTERTESGT